MIVTGVAMMEEERKIAKEQADTMENSVSEGLPEDIPGTAQIRKITARLSSMELLELCARLAKDGYEKKLWSVLSRVFEEKKGFGQEKFDGSKEASAKQYLQDILQSEVKAELKLQTYTSFGIAKDYIPSAENVKELLNHCDLKRLNIAVYFLEAYDCVGEYYADIIENKNLFALFMKLAKEKSVLCMYRAIIEKENKEYITGAIRKLQRCRRKFYYKNREEIASLTELAFASKQVFFTTKLLYCIAFGVPKDCLPSGKEMRDILKISINYEENITKEFIKRYELDFDCSDVAMCRYYLGNKKATKEKILVAKFASHLVQISEEEEKRKLLRGAFKRGGMFRMYAGCMQDGEINIEKLHKFRYSEEDIAWCRELPGLKK